MGKKAEEELAQSQDNARQKHIHTSSGLFCRRRIPKRAQSRQSPPLIFRMPSSPLMLRAPAGQKMLGEGGRREGYLPRQHHALKEQVLILDELSSNPPHTLLGPGTARQSQRRCRVTGARSKWQQIVIVVVFITHTYTVTCCKWLTLGAPQVQSYGSQVKWQQVLQSQLQQGEDPRRQVSLTPTQTEQEGEEDVVVYYFRENVLRLPKRRHHEEEKSVMKLEVARERARRGRLERSQHSLRAEGWREMSGIVRNDGTCASVICGGGYMHVICGGGVHACHMRRRIHACDILCGMTVRVHLSYEEEDTCMSYEEEDTCMSDEEEEYMHVIYCAE